MKIENSIGWCDDTINAVTGCDKVSLGCKNCFASIGTRARVLRAQGIETWGPTGVRYPVNFEPTFRRLNKLCVCDDCAEAAPFDRLGGACGVRDEDGILCGGKLRRIRLFADSNSDWLDPKWPVETLARFLDAIRLAPNVDVLLLTKRIENFGPQFDTLRRLNQKYHCEANRTWVDRWYNGEPPANVWLGVSVEDQKRADERIPQLLKTPAAVRFLSVEPLLGSINLEGSADELDGSAYLYATDEHGKDLISWVIVGGESGNGRRSVDVSAIEGVVDQCVNAGIPVYCKQDVHFKSGQKGRISNHHWSFKQFPKP